MKRTFYIYLTALLAIATSAFVIASAQAGVSTAHATRVVEVELHHTSLGEILSTSSGFTLYEFTRDRTDSDSCAKISGCLRVWPALQSSGKPKAGAGVRASLLSTIKLPGGASQVTYAGHPLYLYSADTKPGETSYVGVSEFGGWWYALNAAGSAVR
jgi:predicted lipoprotein with Yx(FWY)xxD motif